jgi:GT2 family glycosyltransferase
MDDADSPLISIVITNYKNDVLIQNCIKSILDNTYQHIEIIIVDCLTKNIETIFKNNDVKLIHLNRDVGAAKQHNIGFDACDKNSQYTLILDNDTELETNAIMKFVNYAHKHSSNVVFQPTIFSLNDKNKLIEIGLTSDIFGIPKPNKSHSTPFFGSGCGLFVKTEILRKIQYDPQFYLGVDDLDFCWRLNLLGHSIMPVPDCIIYHKAGATSNRLSERRLYFCLRNTIRMVLKNYSFPRNFLIAVLFIAKASIEGLILISCASFFKDYKNNVASMAFKKINHSKLIFAFIGAIYWNINNMHNNIVDHVAVQNYRIIDDALILKKLNKHDLIFISSSYV